MDELLARLWAAVRRAEPTGGGDDVLVETDGFTVDLAAKKVDRGGEDVRLTPTEWHPLEVLVRNTGRLVGQKQLRPRAKSGAAPGDAGPCTHGSPRGRRRDPSP